MRLLPFVLLFAACSDPVALHDQYDQSIGPLFGAPEDALASPYQVGVTFDIELIGRDALVTDLTLVSSDEDVLSVLEMRTEADAGSVQRFARVQTTGSGTADLQIRQDARTRHTATIEVMTPDRVVLAPLQRVVSVPQDVTVISDLWVDRIDVLAGSEAEFELLPMAGDELLTGGIAPELALPNGVAEAGQYRTDNEFDVVSISPAVGADTLTLTYPGQTFTAEVEGHEEAGPIDLLCIETAAQADEFGGNYGCVATAQTTDGEPLFGLFPEWLLVLEDGTTTPLDDQQLQPADILSYQPAEDSNGDGPEVRIAFAGQTDTERVFGPMQNIELQNSNTRTACSAVSPLTLWLAGPALLLLGLRRRRD